MFELEEFDEEKIKQIEGKCDYQDSFVSCPMPVTPYRYEKAVAHAAQVDALRQAVDDAIRQKVIDKDGMNTTKMWQWFKDLQSYLDKK